MAGFGCVGRVRRVMEDHTTQPTAGASSKPWWQSKTILGLLPALLALLFGSHITDAEARELTGQIAGAVSLALVVNGRRKASQPLSL